MDWIKAEQMERPITTYEQKRSVIQTDLSTSFSPGHTEILHKYREEEIF